MFDKQPRLLDRLDSCRADVLGPDVQVIVEAHGDVESSVVFKPAGQFFAKFSAADLKGI